MSKSTYPTWRIVSRHVVASEEAIDGTPDFIIAQDRDTGRWHVKWRTSAHWSDGSWTSLRDAQASVEREVAR
jgi:hypothetical protein